ncbi:MAG: DUF3347 domain-containing protein, partial [Planctomycetota bacterium]
AAASDISEVRTQFGVLSAALLEVTKAFGQSTGAELHEAFCPMAFDDEGASWLQEGTEIRNPYFGSDMLGCGEIKATFPPTVQASAPPAFREQITRLLESYLKIVAALTADDARGAVRAAEATDERLTSIRGSDLPPMLATAWRTDVTYLKSALESLGNATDLPGARQPLAPLSERLLEVVERYGTAGPDDLVEAFCPMAFDNRGASWLQRGDEILNPYFGSEMLTCGEVRRRLPPEGGE